MVQKGLAWIKVTEKILTGPIAQFFDENIANQLKALFDAEAGDLSLLLLIKIGCCL